MKPRPALIVAAVLTTFILVLVGAIVTKLVQPSPAEQAAALDGNVSPPVSAVAAPSEATAVVSSTAALEGALAARDAAYQQQLAEAQARIEQANGQLQQVYDSLEAPAAAPPALVDGVSQPVQPPAADAVVPRTAPQTPQYAVSPDQAAGIALAAAPGANLAGQPTIVDFNGTIAYEVPLNRGLVYVDANSGAVLFNDAAAPPPAPTSPPPPAPTSPPAPQMISADQAAAAATAYLGGGTVERVELKNEDGATVYEVRFTNDSRVYVDAYSGQVVYVKVDNSGSGGGDDNGKDDD